jgi:hypothetical protein
MKIIALSKKELDAPELKSTHPESILKFISEYKFYKSKKGILSMIELIEENVQIVLSRRLKKDISQMSEKKLKTSLVSIYSKLNVYQISDKLKSVAMKHTEIYDEKAIHDYMLDFEIFLQQFPSIEIIANKKNLNESLIAGLRPFTFQNRVRSHRTSSYTNTTHKIYETIEIFNMQFMEKNSNNNKYNKKFKNSYNNNYKNNNNNNDNSSLNNKLAAASVKKSNEEFSDTSCRYCHAEGHNIYDSEGYTSCPIILKKNNGVKIHKSKVDFFKKKPVSQYNLITIDSGSSHNFINDVNIMDRKDNCLQEIPPSQNTVSLADGSAAFIKGSGTYLGMNADLVPSFETSLLSVYQLTKKNLNNQLHSTVIFNSDECIVISNTSEIVEMINKIKKHSIDNRILNLHVPLNNVNGLYQSTHNHLQNLQNKNEYGHYCDNIILPLQNSNEPSTYFDTNLQVNYKNKLNRQYYSNIDVINYNENEVIIDPLQNHIINNNFVSDDTNCIIKIPKHNKNKVIIDSLTKSNYK